MQRIDQLGQNIKKTPLNKRARPCRGRGVVHMYVHTKMIPGETTPGIGVG
jgi:hypothetical protein